MQLTAVWCSRCPYRTGVTRVQNLSGCIHSMYEPLCSGGARASSLSWESLEVRSSPRVSAAWAQWAGQCGEDKSTKHSIVPSPS